MSSLSSLSSWEVLFVKLGGLVCLVGTSSVLLLLLYLSLLELSSDYNYYHHYS